MVAEMDAIKVEILDIKTKLNSLLSSTVSTKTTPNEPDPDPTLPSVSESEDKITVVVDIHDSNIADVTVASIEEDISDVEILETVRSEPVDSNPTNQSN